MPTINPRHLLPHSFNQTVYGVETHDPDFVKSILQNGVREPVVATSTTIDGIQALYILSGHRRVAAAIEVGCETVPYRLEQDKGLLWQKQYLLEANKQRV
jgi:ParB-like chromosome segregation protein Spo0J